MTLYTRSIYDKPMPEDGTRISVMSRHTKTDGITLDTRIQHVDEWLCQLSPSQKDVGGYYRHEIDLQELFSRYKLLLQKPYQQSEVQKLAKRALCEDITILCVESDALKCHRSVLAEECRKYEPQLIIVHR